MGSTETLRVGCATTATGSQVMNPRQQRATIMGIAITFWVSDTPISSRAAGHSHKTGAKLSVAATSAMALAMKSRFSPAASPKVTHASAPQPQCSPCLYHSPWRETGRDTNDPLDAGR
jgi:hypothetical protein